MEARANLRLVDPETGEVHHVDARIADLEDELAGAKKTIAAQNRIIGTQERKIKAEEGDPVRGDKEEAKFRALGERWKLASGKKNAVIGKPRLKLMKARRNDGFPITQPDDAEPMATLELAIDGLCAYPYRVYDKRYREGRKQDLDNAIDSALKDEKHVEECARLGWKARQEGWTPEGGWPND